MIDQFYHYWNQIPALVLEGATTISFTVFKKLETVYQQLSAEQQAQLRLFADHLDVFFLVIITISTFLVLGSRTRKASVVDVLLTLLWSGLSIIILFFCFYQIVVNQFSVWNHKMKGKDLKFSAYLPLDTNPDWNFNDLTDFFEGSGRYDLFFISINLALVAEDSFMLYS